MTTATRTVSHADVDAAKGAELRGLYALIMGKSTTSKDSAGIRKTLHGALDKRAGITADLDGTAVMDLRAAQTSGEPLPPEEPTAEEAAADASFSTPVPEVVSSEDLEETAEDADANLAEAQTSSAVGHETAGRWVEAAAAWDLVAALARGEAAIEAIRRRNAAQARVILAKRGVRAKPVPPAPTKASEPPAKAPPASAGPKPKRAPRAKAEATAGPSARDRAYAEHCARNDVKIGDTYHHHVRGEVVATVKIVDRGDGLPGWEYAGTVYPHPNPAADAAGRACGMKSEALNGWLHWETEQRADVLARKAAAAAARAKKA